MDKHEIQVADEVIMSKIYRIRDCKVMIDRDLAELYGVETKRMKESVRRHLSRFPEDFMFRMDKDEFENWRTQFASSNSLKMGLRHLPYCFTEQGVTMLSCILNSERAIKVNIQLIRIFSRMREMLLTHKDILLQLERIEKRVSGHDEQIQTIFYYLKKMISPPQSPRQRIGFRPHDE